MSSELYKDFKVFTAECKSITNDIVTDLFGQKMAVLVLACHTSKNDTSDYRWSISFIGTVEDYVNSYVPAMAYYFDDGLAQNAGCGIASAKGARKMFAKLLKNAEALDVNVLRDAGVEGYSWSEHQAAKLDTEKGTPFKMYGDVRYAQRLTTTDDVQRFIDESIQIQTLNSDKTLACAVERLWGGLPWKHSTQDLNAIESAVVAA